MENYIKRNLFKMAFLKYWLEMVSIKIKNSDYPDNEQFQNYITYKLEGMNGFGDFLIVGDDYSESGGPAYAVSSP